MVQATDAIGIHYNRAARGVIPQATKKFLGVSVVQYHIFNRVYHIVVCVLKCNDELGTRLFAII